MMKEASNQFCLSRFLSKILGQEGLTCPCPNAQRVLLILNNYFLFFKGCLVIEVVLRE